MSAPRDFIPGVPSAGHLTPAGAFWHPGPAASCHKPACDAEHRAALRAKAEAAGIRTTGGVVHAPVERAKCVPECNWLQTRRHAEGCRQ